MSEMKQQLLVVAFCIIVTAPLFLVFGLIALSFALKR